MMAKVMVLVLRILVMINLICERMPKPRGLPELKTRSIMLAHRAKIARCEGDQCL
jgi:hypothetical protein